MAPSLLALALLDAGGALAASTDAPVREAAAAAHARRAAAHARAVAARLQARDIAAARRLRLTEQRASEQTDRIEALAARHDELERRIEALTAQLASLLASLRGMQRAPLLTLLLAPGPPSDAAAAALALRGMAADIARNLAALRASETEADRLAASLGAARAQAASLHAGEVRQATAIEQDLDAARRAADEAERNAREAAGRAATAAAHAPSLKDAIASLEAQQRGPRAAPRPEPGLAADGITTVPVAGPVVQRYGQATDAGTASGLTYAPPPSALVSSPCRGRIDFAGPFRSYGKMVIIDCGLSTRFVLAGLDHVDVVPGNKVRTGEPIGRMPDFSPGAHGRPTLYVQLRRGAETADPGTMLGH